MRGTVRCCLLGLLVLPAAFMLVTRARCLLLTTGPTHRRRPFPAPVTAVPDWRKRHLPGFLRDRPLPGGRHNCSGRLRQSSSPSFSANAPCASPPSSHPPDWRHESLRGSAGSLSQKTGEKFLIQGWFAVGVAQAKLAVDAACDDRCRRCRCLGRLGRLLCGRRQIRLQRIQQVTGADRLGQIAVHPGHATALALGWQGAGGQGNDGRRR